jgi:flagellar assembly protein FliH
MSTQTVNSYTFRQLESTGTAGRTPADVMARAMAQAEQIREQAHAQGYAAGHAQGTEQAQAAVTTALAALADAVRVVTDTREQLAETLTAQAGELSMLTAEHIVAGAIAVEPQRIVDVVRGALRRLTDRHRVTVLVNPEDLETLSQSVGALQAQLGGIEHLDVQADRRIARAGAIAQTEHGEIDASINAQLQTARELVAAALAGDSGAGTDAARETVEPAVADDL